MPLTLSPPSGTHLLHPERMTARERAYAALLALKHGLRCNREDWAYDPASDTVIVEVEGAATAWGVVAMPLEGTLEALERRGWREIAEGQIR